MKIAIRFLAGMLVALSVACGGGAGGGSGAAGVAGGFPSDGNYEGVGTFLTNIRVVDLGSNTPPVDADCTGDISIVVDNTATDVLVGNGSCLTPANSASYTLQGGFLNDTDFEGVITIRFSGVDHVLNFAGSRTGNVLSATFAGRTPQVGNLVIDWNGSFTAERP